MNYLIRRLAIDNNINLSSFRQIISGIRTASDKHLSKVMDTELLKEPLRDYIKENIDSLDTKTLIDMYNAIYNNHKQKE